MEKRSATTIVPEKVFKDQFVTVADLAEFKEDLLLSLARLFRDNAAKTPKKWLKSHEVKSLLNISHGTLFAMRVNGTIPFTKIGNIIYYDYDEINQVIIGRKHQTAMGPNYPNASRRNRQ
jgi:hypothetical protein